MTRTCIFLLFSLLISCTSSKIGSHSGKLDNAFAYDSLFSNTEGFSGSVLVAKKDRIILNKAYGYSNREKNIRVSTLTKFNVASISKIFTAVAILKLEMQYQFSVNDSINKFLGVFTGEKNAATVHHLLCHTAGLIPKGYELDYSTDSAFVRSIKNAPIESAPGKAYRYTNAGYSLLALVVEKVAKMKFEDYLFKEVIRPGGVEDIGLVWEGRMDTTSYATGYNKGVAQPIHKEDWSYKGASDVVLNPQQLMLWFNALLDGRILDKEHLNKLLIDYLPNNETYGLHKDKDRSGQTFYWKGGGLPDFESQFIYYPHKDLYVIFFINNNIGLRKLLFQKSREIAEN